jgi:hypothetical protein
MFYRVAQGAKRASARVQAITIVVAIVEVERTIQHLYCGTNPSCAQSH